MVSRYQVIDQLHFMGRGERLDGLVLDENRPLNDHVCRKITDNNPVIDHLNLPLTLDFKAGLPQFMG